MSDSTDNLSLRRVCPRVIHYVPRSVVGRTAPGRCAGGRPMNIGGLQIHTNPNLVVPGEPVVVRRTARERWLSWPWRPWRATTTIVPLVPDRNVYRTGNIVYMHPVLAQELEQLVPPARRHL